MPYVVDVSGRGPSTGSLARRGLVTFALLAVVIAVLLAQYRGVFRPTFPATALVVDVGDGVRQGADVKLRGVLVGIVGAVRVRPASSSGPAGLPQHELDLELRPELAAGIPAGVTARVVPTNIFGAPSVELVDPQAGGPIANSAPLARGATIPGDESEQALQLQTVMSRLDKVLRAVHPAQLNVALTNIADALRGRGQEIGSIISRLDPYLTTLNGRSDDFTADLRLLGNDLQGLADASPALLDTVDNAVVTAQTLVAKRDQLAAALAGVDTTAGDVNGFLSDNADRIVRVVHDGAGIAGTLAPQRALIPRSLASLGQGATALANGLNRQSGGALSLEFTPTPFAPYTAADCPRYPGLNGPNCGRSVPAEQMPALTISGVPTAPEPAKPAQPAKPAEPAEPAPDDRKSLPSLPGLFGFTPSSYSAPEPAVPGGSVGPVGSPEEAHAIAAVLGTPATGAAGVLLLGPIARGTTVVAPA